MFKKLLLRERSIFTTLLLHGDTIKVVEDAGFNFCSNARMEIMLSLKVVGASLATFEHVTLASFDHFPKIQPEKKNKNTFSP